MNLLNNSTSAGWQSVADTLQQELYQAASDIPDWAVALLVLSSVSTVCTLMVCVFSCGILAEQNYATLTQRNESKKRLLDTGIDTRPKGGRSERTKDTRDASPETKRPSRKSKVAPHAHQGVPVDDMEL